MDKFTKAEAKILSHVEEEPLVRLLQKIIQTQSTNPPGNETELARWLREYFKGVGVDAEVSEYPENRANLLARIRGIGGRPALIFSAHLDTVAAGEMPWKFPPFSGTLSDGRIYGRGAADMKGGLAAMAYAAGIISQWSPSLRGDLIVAFTFDETYSLRGAKQMVEDGVLKDAGAVVVGEPSTLDVFVCEKGALWLKCRSRGRTSHTSMPHLGRNAISSMIAFLYAVERELKFGDRHPLLGCPTVTPSTIRGGVAINVLPDMCEASLDIRLLPGQDHREVVRRVTDIGRGEIEVEVIDWKQPVETDTDAEIVGISLQAVEDVTGVPREPKGVAYYTDGTVLSNRLGIPMVIIGPADTGMTHQPDENVEVARLVQAAKVYVLTAMRYLA